MQEAEARSIFVEFLAGKRRTHGYALAEVPGTARRLPGAWSFHYQATEFIETGDMQAMLVGNGPVVLMDDGSILEGGSLDFSAEDVIRNRRPPR
ncbi:YrhB domain-containing protein [Pararoseomonas sp. SCSIO 73927]|uniref:YrhB domain-containing protein n=1 Tax=Pararoseomonas sp. SCSIO 73927 TaxID=3114537 RepID=UPI0030CABE08